MSGAGCTPTKLRKWAIATFDSKTVDLIDIASQLNKRMGFRVDAWVAANALCDKNGIKDLEKRGALISQIAQALEETYT